MNSITKSFALILIGMMAISCMSVLTAKSVSAQTDQTMPRPAVPEFTAKVVDTTLEVTIKNQPLTPYENGSYPSLYYMFRSGDNNTRIGSWDYDPMYFVLPSTYGGYYKASDSDFTTVSLSLEGKQFPSGQIGIQAVALIGNQYPTNEQRENRTVYAFEGKTSDWSNPQYITTPASSSSPTPTVNPSPHTPQTFPVLVIALIIIAVVIACILLLRKHRKIV